MQMRSSLIGALEIQARVMQALFMRETKTRFGKLKLGYFWAFFESVVHVAVFVAMFSMIGKQDPSGMPLILFLITGITPFLLMQNLIQQIQAAVESNRSLLTFPQVTVFDLAFSRIILEISTSLIVFTLLILATLYFGMNSQPADYLGVLFAICLLVAIGSGLGMLLCALSPTLPSLRNLTNPFLVRPLFFTSGLFFSAEMLPKGLREILLYNPVLHVIEYLRTSFFRDFESIHYNLGYAGAWALGLFALGFATMQMRRDELLAS